MSQPIVPTPEQVAWAVWNGAALELVRDDSGRVVEIKVVWPGWPGGKLPEHLQAIYDNFGIMAIVPDLKGDAPMSNQVVRVDAGHLSEASQAATAWAGYLRNRSNERTQEGRLNLAASDTNAADRIDQAVGALAREAHESFGQDPLDDDPNERQARQYIEEN